MKIILRLLSCVYFVFQLVSAEGSNISDGTSQCTESVAPSDIKVPIERPGDIQ